MATDVQCDSGLAPIAPNFIDTFSRWSRSPPRLKRVEATASHGPGALQLPDKVCPGLQDQSLHPKTHVLRGEQRTRRPLAGSINWEFGWWDSGLWPFLVVMYIYIYIIYIYMHNIYIYIYIYTYNIYKYIYIYICVLLMLIMLIVLIYVSATMSMAVKTE